MYMYANLFPFQRLIFFNSAVSFAHVRHIKNNLLYKKIKFS